MYYGYSIRTTYGWVPAYDNELNVPPSIPNGMLISFHQPTDQMIGTGRALVIYPVSSSPDVITYDGKRVAAAELQALEGSIIGNTNNGTPIIVGPVVPIQHIPPNMRVMPIAINIPGHSPGVIAAMVIFWVCFTLFLSIMMMSWAQIETVRAEAHKYDTIAQSQHIESEWLDDLNGDGIPDIRNVKYNNGEYIQVATSDYGYSLLGGTAQTIQQGLDWGDISKQIEDESSEENMWQTIGGIVTVGIVGGCAFLILRYGLPAIMPPKPERPPAYLPWERVYTPAPSPTLPAPQRAAALPAATPAPA